MNKKKISLILAVMLIFAAFSGMTVTVRGSETQGDEILFTILHTNDEHSAFVPFLTTDNQERKSGGIARLATAIKEVRAAKEAEDEPVILLSGGDFLGETAYGWLSTWGYSPEIECMLMIGYDAITIGNHEYDFGPDILAAYLMNAGYPEAHSKTMLLAANTKPPSDHLLASAGLFLQHGIIELDNGLKVGIFGLIGKDAVSVTSDTGDIEFLDQHETAGLMVDLLQDQGADLIIALAHSGEDEDVILAADVPGIDIIVGGHAHTVLAEPIIEGQTIIVQAGSQTRYLGQLELAYNKSTGRLRVRNGETGEPYLKPVTDEIIPDPLIQERVDYYTGILNGQMDQMTGGLFPDVHASLATSSFLLSNRPRFQETPVGNFITDGMRLITQEITGRRVDVAVQANGSIRGSLIPAKGENSKGELTFYDITNTIGLGYGQDGYPGYSIASIYLTGEEIRRVLEIAALLPVLMGDDYYLQFSGLRYEYSPRNTVLLTVPVIDQPIPSTRSVTRALFYRGEGIQKADSEEGYVTLARGDENLYHLVTDTYILSFLPVAGEVLPQLEVVPKDQHGQPVPEEDFHLLTVPYAGRELKVWETVAMYARTLPPDASGMPQMPAIYSGQANRIVPVKAFPLIVWLLAVLVLLLAAVIVPIVLLLRFRNKRRI